MLSAGHLKQCDSAFTIGDGCLHFFVPIPFVQSLAVILAVLWELAEWW